MITRHIDTSPLTTECILRCSTVFCQDMMRLRRSSALSISSQHPRGRHLLLDGYGSDPERLNDRKLVEQALRSAIEAGGVTILKLSSHSFEPQGVTGYALLTESHISIHTWPEHRYFTADLFFCGGDIDAAFKALVGVLQPTSTRITSIERGAPEARDHQLGL